MKYTYESLNEAIFKIIPEFKAMVDGGVVGNQPMMLKSVAEKFFLDSAWEDRRDFELSMAYHLCQQALKDLHSEGHFNFNE